MNNSLPKIGYFPHSTSLTFPGDRRRFVFFAKQTGLPFEIADTNKKYDVVYLTSSCNITEWIKYKKRNPDTKLIFELIDSYLLEKVNLMRILRGASRFYKGKDSKFYFDFNKAFINIIKVADAVVCSTPLQKDYIEQFNKNVHVSLDYFENEITSKKSDYNINGKIKIVWEGLSFTVENILLLKNVFQQIKDEIELHIITDKVITYPLSFLNVQSKKLLDKQGMKYHFHEWKVETFCSLVASADLAVIPLNKEKELMWNKPENKLLFFWQVGLPVITSPSPAYRRVMDKAGISMCADTESEWEEKILKYRDMSTTDKENQLNKMKDYVNTYHSKEVLIENWKKIFNFKN